MIELSYAENQILCVTNFQEIVSTPFQGEINALCWARELTGDFLEIVEKIKSTENIEPVEEDELRELHLSEAGQLARKIILDDLMLLKTHGVAPILNVIKQYERDETGSFFPTDVYSFHVDRSPIPTDTFLCTYYGEPSEILPNSQGKKKYLFRKFVMNSKKYMAEQRRVLNHSCKNISLIYTTRRNLVHLQLIWETAICGELQ